MRDYRASWKNSGEVNRVFFHDVNQLGIEVRDQSQRDGLIDFPLEHYLRGRQLGPSLFMGIEAGL